MAMMDFGRHRGLDSSEVPVSYLLWAANTMSPVPDCVVQEIDRRSKWGREAAVCQEALANAWLAKARQDRRRARRQRRRGPGSGWIKGADFDRLRAEQGEPKGCPWE